MDVATPRQTSSEILANLPRDGITSQHFRRMLDALPVAIAYIDADRRYRFNNATYKTWFGVDPEELFGQRVDELTNETDYARTKPHIEAALRGEPQNFNTSIEGLQQHRWLDSAFVPDRVAGKVVGFHAVHTDITAQVAAQFEARELAARFEALSVAGLGGTCLTENGLFLEVSERFAAYAGYTPEEMVGRPFRPTLTPASYERVAENIRNGNDKPYRAMAVRKDGTTFPVQSCGVTVPFKGRMVRMSSVRDISERVALEQEVVEASNRIQSRIGRDLHDGLGQTLTGLALSIESVKNQLIAENSSQVDALDETSVMLQQVVKQTRQLARTLAPILDERRGLADALETLAKDVTRMTGLHCQARCQSGRADIGEELAIQLYRIAQEAVNNAVKHAGAKKITLIFQLKQDQFLLAIVDNGRGLARAREFERGMGMKTMAYRADLVNATLSVSAGPRNGTRVVCRGLIDAYLDHGRR